MDRLKAGSLILAIIFLIVGLLIDRGYWTLKEPEFIENMIAEVFGICLGVFVALYS